VFSIATSEFRTNEQRPMTPWQAIVKMAKIIAFDEGRYLRPDIPPNKTTIVVPRDRQGDKFVDISPPERAGVFIFLATMAAGLAIMGIGAVIGVLPRALMLIVVGIVGVLGFMYYLNQRPLIPPYMKMPDAAVTVIMFRSLGALALAFGSGLLLVVGARAARRSLPA
jgi:hypothetical protein